MKLENLSEKYKDKLSGFTAEEIYHTAELYVIYKKGLNNSRVKACEEKKKLKTNNALLTSIQAQDALSFQKIEQVGKAT